jgi:hypothetical protein
MKKLGVAILAFLCFGLVSCLLEPVSLSIYSTEWKAAVDSQNSGTVYLTISGKAEADSVTVRTYGDGVIDEYPLTLDAEGVFNETIAISFTHEVADRSVTTSAMTVVTAEKNGDAITQTLESGDLTWTAE